MRRRSFLLAAAAAVFPVRKSFGQTSLGTLTWVQPDGLWIRELPDGSSRKIASEEGLRSPRFSPSGEWVSYQNGSGKLLVVRAEGDRGAQLPGETCVWLPQENRLATARGRHVAVFAASNGWAVPLDLWKDSGLPVASPNADQFIATRIGNGSAQPVGELYRASFAAPDKVETLLSSEGDIAPYGWSRDGKSVVYWRAQELSASIWADGVDLYSIPASGGPERKLGVSVLKHGDVLNLAPESHGSWLAATSSEDRETWSGQRITTVDLDTGATRDLTPPDLAALCPAWSPDGRSIACCAAPDADVAYRKATSGANITVVNPAGTRRVKVVTPASKIHAVGGGEQAHRYLQQRKIWILDPAAVDPPRQLTSNPQYRDESPLWSADGSHLLFGRMDYGGRKSLWLMEGGGANATQVCPLKINPGENGDWLGFYGYTDWRSAFDWRRI